MECVCGRVCRPNERLNVELFQSDACMFYRVTLKKDPLKCFKRFIEQAEILITNQDVNLSFQLILLADFDSALCIVITL